MGPPVLRSLPYQQAEPLSSALPKATTLLRSLQLQRGGGGGFVRWLAENTLPFFAKKDEFTTPTLTALAGCCWALDFGS